MLTLLVTIIAAVLCLTDVITTSWFLGIAIAGFVLEYGSAGLYFMFGFLKTFYHDILGWHTLDNSPRWSDGLSDHSKCKHCGKDIMQDSQGNWFC